MKDTQKKPLLTDLTVEESATVNGACHHHRYRATTSCYTYNPCSSYGYSSSYSGSSWGSGSTTVVKVVVEK